MRPHLTLALLLVLAGCESDASKLQRLQFAHVTACLPVVAADSIAEAKQARRDRLERNAASREDIAQIHKDIAESQDAVDNPAKARAARAVLYAEQNSCTLAQRNLNQFKQGR